MKSEKSVIIVKTVIFLLCALLSFFAVSPLASEKGKIYSVCNKTLDEKKENVLKLTGVTAGASFAVSLLPGDTGDAVSDKLADMSGYFVAITIGIYIEQWIMAVMGTAAFKVIIPLFFLFLILHLFWKNKKAFDFAVKLMLFSLVLYLTVPVSVWISNRIDQVSDKSVSERIESIQKDSDELSENSESGESSDDSSIISKITSKIKENYENIRDRFNTLVRNMTDVTAAMIVTSCVIPVLVFLFMIWVANTLFGTAFKAPASRNVMTLKAVKAGDRKSGNVPENGSDKVVYYEIAEDNEDTSGK